jgi:methylenetetrahydrofolate reductase (NADPH)
MKAIDKLNKATKPLFSFEILPPLKGRGIQSIHESIDPLLEFDPAFVNVTYHREEYIYKKREQGYLEKISIKKRPGTVGICAAIMNKYNIDTVPHLICGGFSKEETENALIDLHFLGINNILALRGDPIKTETNFVPEQNGNNYAVELVKQVVRLNQGIYQDDALANTSATNFSIGVAGYPEKHFESPNIEKDLFHLKQKVDAGADYIVTQLFYNNEKYFDFVAKCREIGITVPIIPGLKPISTKRQLQTLPKFFHINIPYALSDAIEKCKTDETVKQVGIEWGIEQSKALIAHGAPCLHYYTMGKSTSVKEIATQVF